jgi:hypothetical protein
MIMVPLLLTYTLAVVYLVAPVPTMARLLDMPLNQWPMVWSHDASTGYLPNPSSNPITEIVYRWTRTQDTNFTQQLQCGARHFDLRCVMREMRG